MTELSLGDRCGRQTALGIRKIAVLVLVACVIGAMLLHTRSGQAEPARQSLERLFEGLRIDKPAKPFPAAPFTLSDLSGDQVELARLRGKIVMLYFWTTY